MVPMCLWAPSKDLTTQEQRIRHGGSGEGAPQSKARRRERAGLRKTPISQRHLKRRRQEDIDIVMLGN